jgi:hypothetical protein
VIDGTLVGFSLMTEHGALILHAIVAPIAFAGLSWVYRMFLYMAASSLSPLGISDFDLWIL